MPDYKRIDIGFSIVLKKEGEKKSIQSVKLFQNIMDKFRSFNLLDIDNTVSYLWIQDVSGTQFAVPNYLTSRQLNLKLHFSF